MKTLKIILLNLLALLFINHYVFSSNTNYYVNDGFTNNDVWCSTNGNDSYNGLSPAKPKLTITNLISTYTLGSNDIIYVDTGIYNECARITSFDAGKSNGFITFQGAGISNATSLITGTGGNASSDGCFTLNNTECVKITGFKCTPSQAQPYYGVLIKGGSKHIIISNNHIISNKWGGIRLENNIKHSLILTNTISYNNRTANGWGIVINQSQSNLIKGNIVERNGIYGITVENTSLYNTIRDNLVTYHITLTGIGISSNPFITSVHDNYYINNICYGNRRNIDIDNSYNNIIRSNTIGSASEVGLWVHNISHDNLIEYNYFRSGGSWGLLIISERSYNETIKKNKCYKSQKGGGIRVEGRAAGPCYNLLIISNTCASNKYGGIVADSWNHSWRNMTSSTLINNECYDNNNASGIYLYKANDNVIKSNKCYNNSANSKAGIYLTNCKNNILIENDCYQNWYGLYMRESKQNVIDNNIFRKSTDYGIVSILCTNNQILNNFIKSNSGHGIYSSSSGYNSLITENIIHNNKNGIYFSSSSPGKIFKNIIYRNNNGGGFFGYGLYLSGSTGISVKNNTIFGHQNYGIYTTTIQAVSNNITLSNGTGIHSTVAGQIVSYSCIADGVNVNVTLDASCISNDPLFHDTSMGNEDFYLRYKSPCISTGSSNIIPTCMGASTGYDVPQYYALGTHPHTIAWTTAVSNGAIPTDGKIIIDFPAGAFNLSTVTNVSTTSRWGGTPGGFNFSPSGQSLTITRDDTGTSSTSGETENLIVSCISNITAGTDFQLVMETRTASDEVIEKLISNDFAIGSPLINIKKECTVSRSGIPSQPIPGSTLKYTVFCSNIGVAALLKTIVIDHVPLFTSYVSNSYSNTSGWTIQWSTNLTPDMSYNSTDFTNAEPSPPYKVRWIRWVRSILYHSDGHQEMVFKVTIN